MQIIPVKMFYSLLAVDELFVYFLILFWGAKIFTFLLDCFPKITFLSIYRTLTLSCHNGKGHWIPGCWRLFIAGQEFPLAPRGTVGPQSARSFLVWSNGPLRKRMPHAERWMSVDWDRRKQDDWIEKCLQTQIISHCINRPEQKS